MIDKAVSLYHDLIAQGKSPQDAKAHVRLTFGIAL